MYNLSVRVILVHVSVVVVLVIGGEKLLEDVHSFSSFIFLNVYSHPQELCAAIQNDSGVGVSGYGVKLIFVGFRALGDELVAWVERAEFTHDVCRLSVGCLCSFGVIVAPPGFLLSGGALWGL